MSDTVQSVRLCLAYLLCVPVAEVPLDLKDTSLYDLLDGITDYARGSANRDAVFWMPGTGSLPPGDYLALGEGPRGLVHAVVMRGGQLVYDPHPSQAGLVKARRLIKMIRKNTTLMSIARKNGKTGLVSALLDLEGRPLKDDDVIFQPASTEFPHQRGTILGAPYPCWPEDATTYRERLMYQRGIADERYAATNLREKDDMPALVKRLTAIHDALPDSLRKKAFIGAALSILENLQ